MPVITTVTYKCDCCGAEQTTPTQFWQLNLYARAIELQESSTPRTPTRTAHVCRNCLEEFGLYQQPPNVEEPTPGPFTIIQRFLDRCFPKGVENV